MLNKKLKKLLAVALVTAMTASCFTACGSADTDEDTSEASSDATSDDSEAGSDSEDSTSDASVMEAPSTDGWTDDDKIYVYLWDADGESKVQNILDQMGDLADYIEIVNLNCSGTDGEYQTTVDAALDGGDKYPSVILADESVAKLYSETDLTLDLSSIGISDEMTANMYSYTVDYGTYDGALKAVSWQATPGCLVYRADIAEEVLGTSDPDEVGALLSDWDAFMDVAQQMADAGYYMVSGTNEIKYSVVNQRTNPWVDVASDGSETLQLDDTLVTYLDLAKQLYDGGFTQQSNTWDTAWAGSMAEGNVFCYFGCTWFIGSMEANCTEDSANFGQWRTTTAPESYYWGGTYMCVGADTPNPELAAYFVYMMCCNSETMYNLAADTGDFVNNTVAVDQLIADGVGARDILGGQNPVETFAEAAKSINTQSTYLDSSILNYIDTASSSYNTGTYSSTDEAIQYVKDQVAAEFDYIAQ